MVVLSLVSNSVRERRSINRIVCVVHFMPGRSRASMPSATIVHATRRINHRHADYQSRVGSPGALYFKELPGRPLPKLQYDAGLCTTSSRKTHAARSPLCISAPRIDPRLHQEPITYTGNRRLNWVRCACRFTSCSPIAGEGLHVGHF